jgi:hypothetical protein
MRTVAGDASVTRRDRVTVMNKSWNVVAPVDLQSLGVRFSCEQEQRQRSKLHDDRKSDEQRT